MAAGSRKTWKKKLNFVHFFGKTTPYGEIFNFKIVLKGFIATANDVLCSNFVEFGQWEISKIVGCLPDKKKTSPGSPALATVGIVPKVCPPTSCWCRPTSSQRSDGGRSPSLVHVSGTLFPLTLRLPPRWPSLDGV